MHTPVKVWTAAALGALVTLSPVAFAKNGVHKTPEQRAARRERKQEMAQELGLTDAQKTQLKAIHQATRAKVQAVRANTTLSAEEQHAQIKALHKSARQQMMALLTPQQRAKMKTLRHERHAERKANR